MHILLFHLTRPIPLDAAYRYYRSLREETSAERRGKTVSDLQRKRRHERLARVRSSEYMIIFCFAQWILCDISLIVETSRTKSGPQIHDFR